MSEGVVICSTAVDVQRALRLRAEEVNLSRETLDHLSGLQPGYSAKALSDPPQRGLGMLSMFSLAGALGYAIALVPDEKAMARVRRAQKRKVAVVLRQHWRNAKALGMMRNALQTIGSRGGKAKFAGMTAEQISEHQRRAARMRWRMFRRLRAQASARRASP